MPDRMVSIFIFRSEKEPVLNCPVRKNPRDEKQEKLGRARRTALDVERAGGSVHRQISVSDPRSRRYGHTPHRAGRNPARRGQPAAGA